MKAIMSLVVALATCAVATASSLNVTVVSGGQNSVTVGPGATVNYEVRGTLSDTANEGLALFGFDLTFSGGALAQAGSPGGVINNFVSPNGINNPAGFGGTVIGGALIQVGGGMNTINNTPDNAPFPIGSVVTGIGHSQVVLAQGSLTAPAVDGVYTLTLSNLFANVIKDGETGEVFWATEAATVGTINNLSITVGAVGCDVAIVSANPANNYIDPRQPSNPDGSSPAGINSIVINFTGDAGCLTVADFNVASTSGVAPTVTSVVAAGNSATLTLSGIIPLQAWTTITHTGSGTSTRVGYLPADVNNDKTAAPADVIALINSLNGVVPLPVSQTDIDRSGVAGAPDILRTIDLLNGAGVYDVWNLQSLPN